MVNNIIPRQTTFNKATFREFNIKNTNLATMFVTTVLTTL